MGRRPARNSRRKDGWFRPDQGRQARRYTLLVHAVSQSDQLPNYFAYAHQFALADAFFTSMHGPSFPNHLYTVAAQAGGAINNPIFSRGGLTGVWGCDAPAAARVAVLQNSEKSYVYPCFDFTTLADSLNNAGLSWKYYGVSKRTPGYVWSPFDAIRHIRFSPNGRPTSWIRISLPTMPPTTAWRR